MSMRLLRILLLPAVALLAKGEGVATSAKVSGIYTDLYYNREGGDLLGTELFVVPTESGWFVFYQHWEGGADAPIVVHATVKGDELSFDIPDSYLAGGNYDGRITGMGFEGTWRHRIAGGDFRTDPVTLKRQRSYWEQ